MSLAETYKEAMRLSARMKAEGVSKEDRQVFLEKALKAAWPQGREEPWHYRCTNCNDTGWAERFCTPETPCGRPFRVKANQHTYPDETGKGRCQQEGHSYVVACFCEQGKPKQNWHIPKKEQPSDDYSAATKSKPLSRWTDR